MTSLYGDILDLSYAKNPRQTAVDLVVPGVSISCCRGVPLVSKLQAVAEVGDASLWR